MAIVYIHHFPDNKFYVGITSQKHPENRWMNGKGYSQQRKIANAIKLYGWENIKHYYFFVPDIQTARDVEGYLIAKLDSIENGYNSDRSSESYKREAFDTYHDELLPEEYNNQKMTQYCENIIQDMRKKCDDQASEMSLLKAIIKCQEIQISELKKQKTTILGRILQFSYRFR